MTILATRTFSLEDQQQFAAISGDRNPMHLDALQARRTQAGAPVVHGIHLLLWAVNSFAASSGSATFAGLRAQFTKFVYLDRQVEVQLVQQRPDRVRLVISADGVPRTKITLDMDDAPKQVCPCWSGSDLKTIPYSPKPLNPSFNNFAGYAGQLAFRLQPNHAEALFPAASRWLGAQRLAALASSTHLVGMICPGLHSIYDEIAVRTCTQPNSSSTLSFRVTHADVRVRSVEHEIVGGGLVGRVLSFERTPPVAQASMDSLSGCVNTNEFAGSLALIVGGSRGLGELTAKLIASGGGRVLVTWQQGREDAERVAVEIRAAGGACDTLQYDASRPAREQLAELTESPTHAYYFPTPPIFRSQSEIFSADRLREFLSIYVNGFWDLIQTLRDGHLALSAFYPSSVSVTERPRGMTEYTMAKAAGEVLCADMNSFLAPAHITVARLPRLPSDQTASVAVSETANPIETLLPIIRAVQATRSARTVS